LAEFGVGFGLYFDHLLTVGAMAVALSVATCYMWVAARDEFGDPHSSNNGHHLLACGRPKSVCLDVHCDDVAVHMTCDLPYSLVRGELTCRHTSWSLFVSRLIREISHSLVGSWMSSALLTF
jgi:hypothetical protein